MARLRTHRRSLLRRMTIALLLLLVAAGTGALVLWRLTRVAPMWYAPPPDTQATRDYADRVEYFVLEEAQKIRPSDESWTVRITDVQINAWLAARLPQWIAHQRDLDWPEFLGTPQIHSTDAGIDLAIDLITGAGESNKAQRRFIVARLSPEVVGDDLNIRLEKLGAGRLLLPGEPAQHLTGVVERLQREDQIGQDVVAFLNELTSDGHRLAREIDLVDNRHLRIVDVRVDDGFIDVTFETRSGEARRALLDDEPEP